MEFQKNVRITIDQAIEAIRRLPQDVLVLAFLADKGADAMIAAAPFIINTLQNMP